MIGGCAQEAAKQLIIRTKRLCVKNQECSTCMIRSRDTAGGQAPWNCHSGTKAAVVRDRLDGGTQNFCGCSMNTILGCQSLDKLATSFVNT